MNQSSTAAYEAGNYYKIAKTGLNAITIGLARELGPLNIRDQRCRAGPDGHHRDAYQRPAGASSGAAIDICRYVASEPRRISSRRVSSCFQTTRAGSPDRPGAWTAAPFSRSEMELDLRDRVVLIVGGSSGIGAATARVLGREGAKLALVARRPTRTRSDPARN